jgi:3-deoxy-D-manno-octulosonic-acid transferase
LILLDLVYLLALASSSLYLVYKAITRPRHLAGLKERLLGPHEPRVGSSPCIWVHGVSVGEVAAAEPLVRALERRFPGHEVVITTSTATGQAVARRKFEGKRVAYFPVDFSWAVKRVFRALRPTLVVLVELELWPNFLIEGRRRGVPVVVVNGRISERSFRRYKLARWFWLARRFLPLQAVARYCVQTDQYARRFTRLGVDPQKIVVTGSLKYDGVLTGAASVQAAAEARTSLGLEAGSVVWIGGSTHAPEERLLVDVFARLRISHPKLTLVLAPRHNERAAEVKRVVEGAGLRPVLRSAQRSGAFGTSGPVAPGTGAFRTSGPVAPGTGTDVVIIDTLGELSRLYAAADLVFVGGSLIPHGGQNILEPASLGKPVLFGPHVQNFQESVERLLAARGAVQVADAGELEARLRELLADPAGARALGARALAAIEAAKGATDRTLAVLEELLSGPSPAGAADASPRPLGNVPSPGAPPGFSPRLA